MAIRVSIEGYDSLEQIGVGGMAAVYKARKVTVDKIVAIKVLFPYLAKDGAFIERFQREAKAAARIQHENVVNVIDFGNSDGSYYIVMEYYDGQTLEDILKAHHQMPQDVAVQVLLEVCYGLQSAHRKDTVHRDIKPGNIILTNQGAVKIADFGLAKKSDSTTVITQHGKVIGTPAYMSPEQAAGDNVGPQSDIFSLGVVAYEIFGRKKPFEGKTYSEVLEKIQTFEPLSVSHVNPLVPPEFESVVSRMLEKNLDNRYRDVGEIISDIEKAMEKYRMTQDRRRLTSFFRNPGAYHEAYREKTIKRCLSQGSFYMKKGKTHLEEALLEFKRVIYLDPDNERASKNLERITLAQNKRDSKAEKTLENNDWRAKKIVARKKPRPETLAPLPPVRRRRTGRFVGVLIVLALLTAAGWEAYQRNMIPFGLLDAYRNTPPVLSAPKHLAVNVGRTASFTLEAKDSEGDSIRYYSDELPDGAVLSDSGEFVWKARRNQIGSHKIKFYADDGMSAALMETVIEVRTAGQTLNFETIGAVNVNAGAWFEQPLRAKSSSGEPVVFSLKKAPGGVRIEKDKLIWTPNENSRGVYEAVIKASDGYNTQTQTVTLNVRSVAEQKEQPTLVEWNLPEKANVFVNGHLEEEETRRVVVELSEGNHTLRAELMDGTTGWVENLSLRPGEAVKLEAPELAYGTLSVYFLSGVGELKINGKLFREQPPFSGVAIPVGTHVMTCRMADEIEAREITISIRKDRETIVEYEAGTRPVISHE